MLPKAIVMVVIAIVAVGGATAAYLMTRAPSEAYEFSYNFQPGESYVYDMTWRMEYPENFGIPPVEFSSSETLDVLEVVDDEFDIRDSATMQITIPGETPQTVTVVMTFRMTNKGVRSGLEIENVEPPELWTSMEQMRGQWESYLGAIYQYPTDPVPVGRKWIIPMDFQFQQAGMSTTLAGEFRSSIAGRENMTVGAGTFDCWRLAHKISVSGETEVMDLTATMTMSGEGASWIDPQSGVQTKVNLPLSIKVKVAGEEFKFSINVTMELVEYQAP